jgi:hypothetical protein
MRWGFPRKVPGKRIDKVIGKPALLDTKVQRQELHVTLLEVGIGEHEAAVPRPVHQR